MIRFDNLFRQIRKTSKVFIMGHKNLDLDALASCLAVSNLCERLHRNSYIVIDEVKHEASVQRVLEYIENKNLCTIINYNESKELFNDNCMLIIVDTYIEKRIQNPRIIKHVNNKVFIDHHLFGKPINTSYYIDASSSSCSEMFAELYKKKNFRVNKYIANVLYSGIIQDTNNFNIKTSTNTHEMCSYLMKCGASSGVVNEFIRNNIDDYIKIQKIIFNTEFYKKKYAIVCCRPDKFYETEDLAKVSDTLIMFSGIKASFAIGRIDKETIGVSARSNIENNFDVSKLMSKLHGGGSKTNAATQIKETDMNKIKCLVEGELK